jgi:hypothetical protein
MTTERDEFRPLMLVNRNARYNLVVLSTDTLYVASVWKSQLPRIDLELEAGTNPDLVLPPRAWKIPLKDIERFQFKHVPVVVHQFMNKDVTVHFRYGQKSRKLTLTLDSQKSRDEFVNTLNDRVGPWQIGEAHESPWLILANYLYIMFVIGLMAIFFSGLGLSMPPNDDGSLPSRYWYATGPWGLVVPAMVICVFVLIAGIRQLRTPPIIVTYRPAESAS